MKLRVSGSDPYDVCICVPRPFALIEWYYAKKTQNKGDKTMATG